MIAVADVPASVAWYKKLLGCSNDHGRPDDLAAVHRRARRQGAVVVVAPHENDQAGWTEFTLRDPDGYRVVIVEP